VDDRVHDCISQPVLEDRVEVEVERFRHEVAEPRTAACVCPLPQGAIAMTHPVVRRHPGVLLRLRLREPGQRHAAHVFAHLDHFGPMTKPGEIAAAVLRLFDAHGRPDANGTD
jgi:hypothetical protein